MPRQHHDRRRDSQATAIYSTTKLIQDIILITDGRPRPPLKPRNRQVTRIRLIVIGIGDERKALVFLLLSHNRGFLTYDRREV